MDTPRQNIPDYLEILMGVVLKGYLQIKRPTQMVTHLKIVTTDTLTPINVGELFKATAEFFQ